MAGMLEVIARAGHIKPTHLLYKMNLSWTMMKIYVKELEASGLMAESPLDAKADGKDLHVRGSKFHYVVTDKGMATVLLWQEFRANLEGKQPTPIVNE